MEGGGLAFFFLLGLASLGVVIWAVVDAVSHPDWAWLQSGQSKGLWIALPIVFLLVGCGVIGAILAIVYLASIRPQVVAAEAQGGPYGGGYGGPPGGYGAAPPGPPGPYGTAAPPPQAPPPPSSGPPADPFGG